MNSNVITIIPAYNEGPRIKPVLMVVSEAINEGLLSRAIVVDVGSTDNTVQETKSFKDVEVVSIRKNSGKDAALLSGFERALKYSPQSIMTLDADLRGLTLSHIREMVNCARETDLVIGRRDYKPSRFRFRRWIIDYTGGERVYRAEIVRKILGSPKENAFLRQKNNWGIDIALYRLFANAGGTERIIDLPGLKHTAKRIKIGRVKAKIQNTRMYWQCAKSLVKTRLLLRKKR